MVNIFACLYTYACKTELNIKIYFQSFVYFSIHVLRQKFKIKIGSFRSVTKSQSKGSPAVLNRSVFRFHNLLVATRLKFVNLANQTSPLKTAFDKHYARLAALHHPITFPISLFQVLTSLFYCPTIQFSYL